MATEESGGTREERGGSGGPLGLRWLNGGLAAAAVVVIIVGYVLLDHGSITAAPILLAIGYVVLFPAALLVGYRRADGDGS